VRAACELNNVDFDQGLVQRGFRVQSRVKMRVKTLSALSFFWMKMIRGRRYDGHDTDTESDSVFKWRHFETVFSAYV